jgi:hypothetical protein
MAKRGYGRVLKGNNMANVKYTRSRGASLLAVATIVFFAMTAMAQNPTDNCRPAAVIPLTGASEPPAKIVIDPPLAEPLARGVAQMLWPSRRASDTFM